MLAETMQRIPGNASFRHRFEYVTLARHFYGKSGFFASQILYGLTVAATNTAQMAVTARVMDRLLQQALGWSWALDYSTWPPTLADAGGGGWSDAASATPDRVTLGFALTALLCAPLSAADLDSNMALQHGSLAVFVLLSAAFIADFCRLSTTDPEVAGRAGDLVPAFTGWANQSQVLGITLFFHAYVVTVPSWVNEKAPGVSVSRALWWPTWATALFKIVFGLTGATAFRLLTFPDWPSAVPRGAPLPGAADILGVLLDRSPGGGAELALRYSIYAFTLFTFLPGIPVLSVMARYNLVSGDLLTPHRATWVGIVLPWIVVALTYRRPVLMATCSWVAVLVQGFANFVLPVALYRAALRRHPRPSDGGNDVEDDNIRDVMVPLLPFSSMQLRATTVGSADDDLVEVDASEVDSSEFVASAFTLQGGRAISSAMAEEPDAAADIREPHYEPHHEPHEPSIHALPRWIRRRCRVDDVAAAILWTNALLCTLAIFASVAAAVRGTEEKPEAR